MFVFLLDMSLLSDLINLNLSDTTEKVIAEYIWWAPFTFSYSSSSVFLGVFLRSIVCLYVFLCANGVFYWGEHDNGLALFLCYLPCDQKPPKLWNLSFVGRFSHVFCVFTWEMVENKRKFGTCIFWCHKFLHGGTVVFFWYYPVIFFSWLYIWSLC